MYIFKPNPSSGLDDKLSKLTSSTASALTDASSVRSLGAPVVPAQTAVLAGSSAPVALNLNSIVNAVITAGVASNLTLPLTSEYPMHAANEDQTNSLVGALETFSKNALSNLAQVNAAPVAIVSLSEADAGSNLGALATLPLQNAHEVNAILSDAVTPLSAMPAVPKLSQPMVEIVPATAPAINAPVIITALTDNELMLTSSSNSNVQVGEISSQAAIQSYINTGEGVLTVATSGSHLSSLSLTGNVSFTAHADEVTTGITVSAIEDSSDVSLFLVGGASAKQGSVDAITLGNGNNLILDAGDGQVAFTLGNGTNVILLTGVGVSGTVTFAVHNDSVGEFVTIAANGAHSTQELASNPLVTLSGLNNREHSLDTITFLGDMGANLNWAGGSAKNAQVTQVTTDLASLVSWVGAAQEHAANAHNVAWFQFEGNTYVLESATGNAGSHAGDTLVRLTGLTQFTGNDGELAFGALHLAG
jgi:hypothetical protein